MKIEYLLSNLFIGKVVYPPAEDTVLLLKSIDKLILTGKEDVLDMCCGTGAAGIYISDRVNTVTFVDILPEAIECAKRNAERFNVNGRFITSDLFDNVDGIYDIILFNPPYLPTDDTTRLQGKFNVALDGGPDGRKVIDKFIEEVNSHVHTGSQILMVDSSLDNTNLTIEKLKNKGYDVKLLTSQKFFFETINILHAVKNEM